MRWALIVVAGLAALVLVCVVAGLLLPQSHVAARSARYRASPATVWAVITDVSAFSSWRPDVKKVELMSTPPAPPRWREIGERPITFEQVEVDPPNRMVVHIADASLPFGGGWSYELAPADGGGTTLNVTEHGEVYNPIFRFVSRFIIGHTASLDGYLRALGTKLGEQVTPIPGTPARQPKWAVSSPSRN